jgi:hypothetical protein
VSVVFAAVPAPVLLAHQGGWDEALLIAGPMLAIVGLLWLAKRRVVATRDAGPAADPPVDRPADQTADRTPGPPPR